MNKRIVDVLEKLTSEVLQLRLNFKSVVNNCSTIEDLDLIAYQFAIKKEIASILGFDLDEGEGLLYSLSENDLENIMKLPNVLGYFYTRWIDTDCGDINTPIRDFLENCINGDIARTTFFMSAD